MKDLLAVIGGAMMVALAAPFVMVFVLVLTMAMGLIMAWPLMWAWNYVIPGLFGLHALSYWQAFSLLVVATLLVKGGSSSSSGNSKS
jgi:hypothetical protein